MSSSLIFFILMLVTIVTVGEVIKMWMKQRKIVPEETGEFEDTLARIDQLEDRVKVLERIVTENRFDLKNEIDSL
jgi:hypothetical protein